MTAIDDTGATELRTGASGVFNSRPVTEVPVANEGMMAEHISLIVSFLYDTTKTQCSHYPHLITNRRLAWTFAQRSRPQRPRPQPCRVAQHEGRLFAHCC